MIPRRAVDLFSIGFCDEPLSGLYNRITFPILALSGEILAIQGRYVGDWKADGVPKYWNTPYEKGKVLYGLHESLCNVQELDYCFVTEGPIDAINLVSLGIPAVAVLGANFTEHHAIVLGCFYSKIIACGDSDKTGNTFSQQIKTRVEAIGCVAWRYTVPEQYKDFNEFFVATPKIS